MTQIALTERPRICKGFRLQWEAVQSSHVLLYPEGMVKLNRSAGEILSRCNGALSVEEVIADLERSFANPGLGDDVREFLILAAQRGWVEVAP